MHHNRDFILNVAFKSLEKDRLKRICTIGTFVQSDSGNNQWAVSIFLLDVSCPWTNVEHFFLHLFVHIGIAGFTTDKATKWFPSGIYSSQNVSFTIWRCCSVCCSTESLLKSLLKRSVETSHETNLGRCCKYSNAWYRVLNFGFELNL